MISIRWIGLSALISVLAACGGGSYDSALGTPSGVEKISAAVATPSAVPKGQIFDIPAMIPAPAAAGTSNGPTARLATPSSIPTAEQFFDWAERTHFLLFPGPQVTQSLPPFVLRYYPSTATYLAVSDGVIFALGPVTNNKVIILGKVADFACFISIATCIPAPVAEASAVLTAPTPGKTPWNLATPISVTLLDKAGKAVGTPLTCTSLNPTTLTVASDCSSATGLRLGPQSFTVAGGGVSATTSIKVIPQMHPLGTVGANDVANIALLPAGEVLAWGKNDNGVLGQGKTSSQLSSVSLPVLVKDQAGTGTLSGIVSVAMGDGPTALALTEDGEVWSWGSSTTLGRTSINGDSLPGKVRNAADNGSLSGIVAIAIGDDNALALADDGTVYAWGSYTGTLLSGSGKLPSQVKGVTGVGFLRNVVAISAGWNWSAALTSDGKVATWGFNSSAATGQGLTTSTVDAPGYVIRASDGAAISDVVSISAGYNFGLALTRTGQVLGWGSNSYGQLGQNTENNTQSKAVSVKSVDGSAPIGNIKMVAAGGNHALALDLDGKVYSWGLATSGQLGDGPNRPTGNRWLLPRAVVSELGTDQLTGISSVAAAYNNSLALGSDGRLLIWGDGFGNKLGQGGTSTANLTVPTPVKNAAGTGNLSLAPISVWPNLTRRGL